MTSLQALALRVQLPGFPGTRLDDEVASLLSDGLGGVCLFGGNMPAGELTEAIRDLAPHAVIAVDEEGGDVTRLHAASGSPVLGHAALGVVDDTELTRHTAGAIGTSLVELGVSLDLGPVADVNSNPDNPVIGVRSFGADPALVARHVAAYVDGMQAAGVAACAKHFPGHGDTHEDSHLALPRVEATLTELRARELVPFAAAVEAGVAAVMTSHLVVPAIDEAAPATMSAPVLRVLREELGFTGVIVTDALDMAGASAARGVPRAAVDALRAGCDLLCLGAEKDPGLVRAIQVAIVDAVRVGTLDEARLAEAASRVAGLGRRTPRLRVIADADRQLGGARSALRIEGDLPDLTHAVVTRVDSPASIAVGEVPWGIAPGRPSESGPVILQVRDAHLHPDAMAMVDKLGERAIVVEYGWPAPWTSSAPRICTFGASLPAQQAVAGLLRERGWRG